MIITDKAKEFVQELMEDSSVFTLRFTFEGEGCCGPNYGITLEKSNANDRVTEINGIEVAIDPNVLSLV
nr:adhesin [Brevibacillus laterosporus]